MNTVAVVAGTILPRLAVRDRRLMADKGDVDEDAEISRLRATVRQWRIEAARRGRELHLPVMNRACGPRLPVRCKLTPPPHLACP